MQAKPQQVEVGEFRNLEQDHIMQDEMMLANEYAADQHAQFNNTTGAMGNAAHWPGRSKGAGINQKAGLAAQDPQANYKLLKPASNSNSSPDIKSQLYKIAAAKQS
jgi:hypothetical protein